MDTMSHHLARTAIDTALSLVKLRHGYASELGAFIAAHRAQNMPGGSEDARVDYNLFVEDGRRKLPAYVTAEAYAIELEIEVERGSKLAAE